MNFVVGGGEGDAHAEPDRRAHTSQNHVLASTSTCTHTPTLIFILLIGILGSLQINIGFIGLIRLIGLITNDS